jgi:hypothetical protein
MIDNTVIDYKKASSVVKGRQLREYFLEHVVPLDKYGHRLLTRDCFWMVTKDLRVFKSTANSTITALTIPAGAFIFAPRAVLSGASRDDRKMRANMAIVHSIYSTGTSNLVGDHFGAPRKSASSRYSYSFPYAPGETVKPVYRFGLECTQCASGIHFFLNFNDALRYS